VAKSKTIYNPKYIIINNTTNCGLLSRFPAPPVGQSIRRIPGQKPSYCKNFFYILVVACRQGTSMDASVSESDTDARQGGIAMREGRRPWRTPNVILASASHTEAASALPDDGPSSVS
jgi:hypothetical protein